MGPTGLSMARKHLKFIRVSMHNVVQLELHPFLTAAHVDRFDRHWFLDQHMKEVEGILKTVIVSCQTWGSGLLKDKDVKKLTQTCLLGPTVRLGVTLKPKIEHQSLLNKSSCNTDYTSWNIHCIKLVGYVCPRLQGLTQSVSSAFGKLLQKSEDMEHTDISSYFQPLPSTHSTLHTAPTSTTTTTTSTTTTTVTSCHTGAASRSCAEVVNTARGTCFAVHHRTKKEENKQPTLSRLKRQTERERGEKDKTDNSSRDGRGEHRTADGPTEKREEHRTADSPTEKREEHSTADSISESEAAHRKAVGFREKAEHSTADNKSERREEHRTAKKERREENRPAEKERGQKVTTAEKERKEKIRKAEKERREGNGTAEKENREENGTAEKVKRKEKGTAEKVKGEEKGTAVKEKREEKRTAEKQKREKKGTAEKEKREEKGTAEKEKREEKGTAEKEKREEKGTAEKEGREKHGKNGPCPSTREKCDRQERSDSKPWKREASPETEQCSINRHSPPHTQTPPTTPEGQTPPPADRHQTPVSEPQDRRGDVCNREQPMTPDTKTGSKSCADLSSDDGCLSVWELPDLAEPDPKVMPHSAAQGHRSPSCSEKATTTTSTHGAGKKLGKTGMVDKKAESPEDQRSKGNQCRTSSGSGSDDSRESACKKADHSKTAKPKSSDRCKAPQKRFFQLVDIDFGFSSPEMPSKKKCVSSPVRGVGTHQVKESKSEESVKPTHKKPCLDDRVVSQEGEEVQSDRKTEKRSSPVSCDVKTPSGSVNTTVAGAPPSFKKSRKLGLHKGATSRPETLSLQRSLFPTSTTAALSKRKDLPSNFKHTATSKQKKDRCEDWLPSLSPLACGKAAVSPQTEGRSDSDTCCAADSSSGSSPWSSSSKHVRHSPPSLSKPKNSPTPSSKTAMSSSGKASGKVCGSPQASVSTSRSASTPKSSRTLPGTPSSPRTADVQPGSPSTPKASGTPQTWPSSPESTASRKHSHQHRSQIAETARSKWVESQSEDWLPNLDEAWCGDPLLPCAGNSSSKTLCAENSARRQSKAGSGVVDVGCSSHSPSATDSNNHTKTGPERPSVKNGGRKAVKRRLPSSPENSWDPALKKRCRKVLGERTPLSSLAETSQSEDVDADTSVRCLGWLSDEKLKQLMKEFKDDLTAISQGTLYSHRHQLYIKGGHARRELDHTSNLQYFASGQEDAVMDILMTSFSRTLLIQEVDYMLRVLLPEALTRIYKQVTGRTLP